jgi:tetratricopeptide (TPR) repeat protein
MRRWLDPGGLRKRNASLDGPERCGIQAFSRRSLDAATVGDNILRVGAMTKPTTANHSARDRQRRRDLDIEISFLEGLMRRDPGYVDALRLLGDDYTERGRFEDGLRVDERLIQHCPEDPMAHYNLACSYTLTGQLEQAANALNHALDLGYRDLKWLRRDPDLRKLRQHPIYRKIRAKLRSLAPAKGKSAS